MGTKRKERKLFLGWRSQKAEGVRQVFFFLAYFTLYNRLQFHPSHQNWFKWILFDFFFLLCRSEFLTYIIFLVSEGLPLTFLARQTTGNTFFFRESHYFSFTTKWLFPRVQNSRLVCCFLSNCKYVTLFFLFARFQRKVRCNFYLSFSLGEMFISSSFFKKIFVYLWFSTVDKWHN